MKYFSSLHACCQYLIFFRHYMISDISRLDMFILEELERWLFNLEFVNLILHHFLKFRYKFILNL
jgi:hypothetical protein